jgi:tRNA(Ile)-lysidine synthase
VDSFLTKLARLIREERLLPARTRLLVAVSGGLDSMVLLTALVRLRDDFNWRLEVAHFNHQLRGRAADADERFVRRACAKLAVPCHVGHWPIAKQAAAIKSGGIERAARFARHAFLGATAARIAARRIVLAHHADDQVELFFVRLLRGAGSLGLGGMRPRTRHGPPLNAWLIRPFLDLRRAELAAWAATEGVAYREDASNCDPRFLRNQVRHELLPLLTTRFSPATPTVVLRTMKTLADEADWLRAQAEEFLATPPTRRPAFASCHPALQRGVLALQLEQRRLAFDAQVIERLRENAGVIINTPGNQLISRDEAGRVRIHAATKPEFQAATHTLQLNGASGRCRFGSVQVGWSLRRRFQRTKSPAGQEMFDSAVIGRTIILRHWQPGDRFQPIGMKRPVKLQNLFTNARVPAAERRRRVIATTAAGEIFWVEGVRIAERFKLTAATQTCLVWHVQSAKRERKNSC